jgi:hypothetical protein
VFRINIKYYVKLCLIKRIIGHKREEVAGGRNRLIIYNLYASSQFITVIKSSETGEGHVEWSAGLRNAYKIMVR